MAEDKSNPLDEFVWQVSNFVDTKAVLHGENSLNAEEKAVYFATLAEKQIAQDGLYGFFHNYESRYPVAAVSAMNAIGLLHHAKVLKEALSLVPEYAVAQDHESLNAALAKMSESVGNRLRKLDRPFFDADKVEDFYALVLRFVREHGSSFPAQDQIELLQKDLSESLKQKANREEKDEHDERTTTVLSLVRLYSEQGPNSGKLLRYWGGRGDFSPESLWDIVTLIEDYKRTGEMPTGANTEDVFLRGLGIYAGEVVRIAKRGLWASVEALPGVAYPGIEVPRGKGFMPIETVEMHANSGISMVDKIKQEQGIDAGPRPVSRSQMRPWWKFW